MEYGWLIQPHPNLHYREAMAKLALAEWPLLAGQAVENPRWQPYQGLPLLRFTAPEPPLAAAARFSMGQALFRIGAEGLQPVWAPEPRPLEEMASLLKYKGKTNEIFTRFLLNLAVASGAFRGGAELRVLDPVCGRGTGLFVAAAQGYAALGIERDKKAVQELHAFLKRYFTYHRYKHEEEHIHYTKAGKPAGDATRFAFATVERWKAGERQELLYVRGDAAEAEAFFRRGTVQAVFGDLPYGVQHAGHEGGAAVPPVQLLRRALPAWQRVLAPGGAVALAFNSHTLKRRQVWEEMARCGLEPLCGAPYDNLEHFVEQAVMRDVAVGRKPQG